MKINPNRSVLALDLASVTGWAVIGGGIITSGSQDFRRIPPTKNRPAQHAGETYAMFRRWLSIAITDNKPKAIAYEEVCRWMSYKAAHTYCGLRAIMLSVVAPHCIPCYGYAPTSIKKHWTGNGASKKPAMIAEAKCRHPQIDITDDNEADALAILSLHLNATARKAYE